MNPISVRKMNRQDIEQVLIIETHCFAIPWTKGAFEKELKENKLARYVVAEVNENVVAYGGMWLIIDEGHITNIAVHPEYQGQKIGKEIVLGLMEVAKEANLLRLTLEVRKSNLIAQQLYRGMGFIISGIRPGYYHDNGEDAIIMWKDL
ncbi:ribosomal-protein-alanine acetyltransferase [Alkaliphilus metalliredigens QYMF]|uniref:[Ribosomal protein bS18]-alanine N-acetyltransferase n=1 Tax=Alkaliphilus metalliredigens (strain QYMF) TaxID=293826 RepID=A6TLG2_ALKMQ|nr:ribosomal protein S18-alanine N-acetyltransferase [Alkaliphilus metalliredigens]ABR47030.1 ribosomal-protein-alanine acetyltransferase [Alkaliphilus metalliredigens QYMF]